MPEMPKVMVVEDNDFVRMQIVGYLTDAGFDVIEAGDGRDALDKITPELGLAMVDVRMEPIDGFEFIRSLRADGNDIPVILVTGDQNPELLNEAGKLGVSAVLMKPVQKDRLVKVASRTLRQAQR